MGWASLATIMWAGLESLGSTLREVYVLKRLVGVVLSVRQHRRGLVSARAELYLHQLWVGTTQLPPYTIGAVVHFFGAFFPTYCRLALL